jgi:RNA polymerase sigma factor (sigma-70 family)
LRKKCVGIVDLYGFGVSFVVSGGGEHCWWPIAETASMMSTLQERVMDRDGLASSSAPAQGASAVETLSPEKTVDLLTRIKAGDAEALERLLSRCMPPLRRWAHGRLPGYARDMQDTADLVQDTIVSALKHLDRFEPRHEGALQAYLRGALANRIIDIIRKTVRRPAKTEMPDDVPAIAPSALEQLIGQEKMARYDAALARLRPADREAIIARVELQYRYDELAIALGKPSVNAARVAVSRAIQRLAEEMRHVH